MRVSSLSKINSSACFILASRGRSDMEERIYVGLKRRGARKISRANRSMVLINGIEYYRINFGRDGDGIVRRSVPKNGQSNYY